MLHPVSSPLAVMTAMFRFSDESSAVARDDLDRFFARFQSLGILSYQSLGTTPGISTDMGVD
jgi:hypothetical protein